jgi:hypothetical protein
MKLTKKVCLVAPNKKEIAFFHKKNLECAWFYDGTSSIVLDIKCISTKHVNVLG